MLFSSCILVTLKFAAGRQVCCPSRVKLGLKDWATDKQTTNKQTNKQSNKKPEPMSDATTFFRLHGLQHELVGRQVEVAEVELELPNDLLLQVGHLGAVAVVEGDFERGR
jgi:hypothetical protein